MTKVIRLVLPFVAFSLCGCATEQLRDTTVGISATTTDIYYQMVLQNLARTYEEPDGLPWGLELSAGSMTINDTDTLTGGYSEKTQAVTPTAGVMGNRALQRSWSTAPLTKLQALLLLKKYYTEIVTYSLYQDYQKNPGKFAHLATLKYLTNPSDPSNPANQVQPPIPDPDLAGIDLGAFSFREREAPPLMSVYGTYRHTSAYVVNDADKMKSLTEFTLRVMKVIDTVPSSTGSASPSAQPLPLLNL